MARDPAVLLYTGDFLIGVADMPFMERGYYITLLCLQHQKGHLSEETICFALGLRSVSEIPKVMEKFEVDEEGKYFQHRMEEETEKRSAYSESRRSNGSKGGRPPKEQQPVQNHMENHVQNHMGNHMGDENENINIDINRVDSRGDIGEEEAISRARKKTKTFPQDSKAYKAAAYLDGCICKRLPTQKPSDEHRLQSWAVDFDKCHRIDGQSWDDIARVVKFSQEDPFWQNNILSGGKFREKFVQLLAKMQSCNNGRNFSGTSAMSDLQKLHEQFGEEDGGG